MLRLMEKIYVVTVQIGVVLAPFALAAVAAVGFKWQFVALVCLMTILVLGVSAVFINMSKRIANIEAVVLEYAKQRSSAKTLDSASPKESTLEKAGAE